MRSIVLAAMFALLGVAAHAQAIVPVDVATISMSAPGVPRTVTNTVCVTDGNDLACDRDVYIDGSGQVGIGISNPRAELDVPGSIYTDSITAVSNVLVINVSGTNTYFMGNNGSGRVGINMSNGAGANLHVSGSTILSGTVQARNSLFVNGNGTASTTLHVSGTMRLGNGGEACDTNRIGAIRYTSGDFSFCRNGSAWENLTSLAGSSDRIVSGTSAVVVNSATGIVSITQLGAVASYVHPSLGYVGPGVSATGTVSGSKVATNEVKLSGVGGNCSTLADEGRMFRNPTTGRLQVCALRN